MKLFSLLVWCLAGNICILAAQDCDIRFAGHVEDVDIKEKLAGATVVLQEVSKQVITDENGDFIFEGLCPGEYTLYISHVNCDPVTQKIKIEKNRHQDFFLDHARRTLGAVVVESQKAVPNTGFKQELAGKLLEQTRGLSLAESLRKLNGVTLLQTGATISKPVIHGLHGTRLLTINNGVRQEGQQWGNEHAPEIDPYIADRMVVIKGVDQLKYGSDAIAGVVLLNPKALRHTPGSYAEINTGYFSNNRQYGASAMLEQQLKQLPAFSYRVQGSFKKAANTRTPDYRLNNTALQEINFSLTAGWKKERYDIETFYSQFQTKIGIAAASHLRTPSDLNNAIHTPKPDPIYLGENSYEFNRPYQQVLHRLFKAKANFHTGFGKLSAQFATQYNNRHEYDIVRDAANKGAQLRLSVITLSEDISWEHLAYRNFTGTVGIAGIQQDNSYGGNYFIPAYQSNTYGAYWIEKWRKHQWEVQAGFRYDNKNIRTTRYPYNQQPISHVFNYNITGASLHSTYKASDNVKLNAGLILATRAPFVNELLSDGVHQGTAFYETGFIGRYTTDIPNIKPEQSYNIVAGASFSNHAKTFNAEISLYNNFINRFIYLQPMPLDTVATISGRFPHAVWKQTNARLTGMDINVQYELSEQWVLNAKSSILRAYNRSMKDWLIAMPSDRVSAEITYNFKEQAGFSDTYVSLEVPVVFKQTRVPDENIHGPQDYKAPPAGYTLLNLNASTTLLINGHLPVTIGLSARNLLNKSYREYLNSFRYFADEMGRNIGIRLKIPVENLL